jgi:hypothetical protein
MSVVELTTASFSTLPLILEASHVRLAEDVTIALQALRDADDAPGAVLVLRGSGGVTLDLGGHTLALDQDALEHWRGVDSAGFALVSSSASELLVQNGALVAPLCLEASGSSLQLEALVLSDFERSGVSATCTAFSARDVTLTPAPSYSPELVVIKRYNEVLRRLGEAPVTCSQSALRSGGRCGMAAFTTADVEELPLGELPGCVESSVAEISNLTLTAPLLGRDLGGEPALILEDGSALSGPLGEPLPLWELCGYSAPSDVQAAIATARAAVLRLLGESYPVLVAPVRGPCVNRGAAPNLPICSTTPFVETPRYRAWHYGLDAEGRFRRGVFGALLHGFESVRLEVPPLQTRISYASVSALSPCLSLASLWRRLKPPRASVLLHRCLGYSGSAPELLESPAAPTAEQLAEAELIRATWLATYRGPAPRGRSRGSLIYSVPQGSFYSSVAHTAFPPVTLPPQPEPVRLRSNLEATQIPTQAGNRGGAPAIGGAQGVPGRRSTRSC